MGVTTLSAGDTQGPQWDHITHLPPEPGIWSLADSPDSLRQQKVLDGGQRVVDPEEILLAVLFQDQGVEVQVDPVAWLGPQQPLQFNVGRVGGVREAGGLDHTPLVHVDVEGLFH